MVTGICDVVVMYVVPLDGSTTSESWHTVSQVIIIAYYLI